MFPAKFACELTSGPSEQLTSSIKENPRLRAAAEELRKAGVKVGDAVTEALKTMEESELVRAISRASAAVSSTIEKTTEPIRKTEAYKAFAETVIDALDDSGSAKHAGFEEKEATVGGSLEVDLCPRTQLRRVVE